MIQCSPAVSLLRRPIGEWDRLTILYTRDFGKVAVRFAGVLRPLGKLKALSEPLVWGDYRLFLGETSEYGKCVGGALFSAFPAIRSDLSRQGEALHLLELMNRLTPDRQPSSAKYELLTESLESLERGASGWLAVAYALRLFELAGFGMRGAGWLNEAPALWDALHDGPLGEVAALPEEPVALARLRAEVRRHTALFLDQPLKTMDPVVGRIN